MRGGQDSARITVLARGKDALNRGNHRTILRREELVAHAARVLQDRVQIQDVGMATLPVRDQASLAAATDILVGAHGAGLAWAHLMPPGAVMIELSNYYRFGATSGINQNCGSCYGSTAALFQIQHVMYYSPQRSRREGVYGSRGANVDVSPDNFVALLEVALCLLREAPRFLAGQLTRCNMTNVRCPNCLPSHPMVDTPSVGCVADGH